MPITSPRNLLIAIINTIEPSYYRLGMFFVMSMLDDPAMLAFALS